MDIDMYNTQFGDCFRIGHNNQSLIVDFGIHAKSLPNGAIRKNQAYTRDTVHEKTAEALLAIEQKNLLLTHYHVDHISGLLYMYENQKLGYREHPFETVYLPDVWSWNGSKDAVTLMILEELFDHAYFSARGKLSLLELIKYLCEKVSNVTLLKRGSQFEKNPKTMEENVFTALWPDPEHLDKSARQKKEEIEANRDILTEWVNGAEMIAEELIKHMQLLLDIQAENLRKEDAMPFGRIQERAIMLAGEIRERCNGNEDYKIIIETWRDNLNAFGNQISIVFHNTEDDPDGGNVLFTGDIHKSGFTYIKKHDNPGLHATYRYIKLPHHGTRAHHRDFVKFSPKVLMIPNGKVGGVHHAESYKICEEYRGLIQSGKPDEPVRVYCSNSNWCEMNCGGTVADCTCGGEATIIFPEDWKPVR